MAYFIWGPQYFVGVEELNNQHKKLVDIINQLYKAMEDKSNKAALGSVILELINYTKNHFSTEEAFMKKYEYPDYDLHKKEHEAFVQKVSEFYNDFKANKITLSFEISVFLKNWLIKHICTVDRKYGPYFNNKGLK